MVIRCPLSGNHTHAKVREISVIFASLNITKASKFAAYIKRPKAKSVSASMTRASPFNSPTRGFALRPITTFLMHTTTE